ncbi:MAG: Eco57I restriction-modification methylase domain-containing protein [Halolamina sp.]
MNGPTTQGGFVVRAVEGLRGLFDGEAPATDAARYVPTLVRRLFGDGLGYDDTAYSQREEWSEVHFVDETGQPAIILTATDAGEDIRTARRRAFRAASAEPSVRYLVITNRNRLVTFARCSPDRSDATTRDGVTARPLTEIDLRDAVERSYGRSLAEALTPGQQLSFAKLTALRREAVTEAVEDGAVEPDDLTLGDLAGVDSASAGADPGALAETLTETLADVLSPAVEDAFSRLSRRIQEFADSEAALEERIAEAKAAGDEAAVTQGRADLFDLREEYATARRLEAGFARWKHVTPDEDEATFCAEAAAVALDTLLLARVAADRGLAGDFDAYRAFWEEHAEHAERDAGDLVRAVREELAGVSEDATDDGTFAWVFEADIADAFEEAVTALSAVDVGALDATQLTEAFDSHLGADGRPVRGATRPATAGLLLDRAAYTADALIDDPGADLLDPACGDGSVLVGAADRLLARLGRTDASPAATLTTVRDRLHGLDSHPYAVHLAETRLLLRTLDVHADAVAADDGFSLDRFSVHRTDALRTEPGDGAAGDSPRVERRDAAAAAKDRADFGFVVSDTPTTDRSALPDAAVEAYDAYGNADGEYDLSMLFLERATDWLADGGRLSMAVNGDLLDSPTAAGARERLTEAFQLRELVDFDTGGESTPLFVAAERRTATDAYEFTYARVTPTFLDLVREGLVRPDDSGNARPAELVGRCLPDDAGGSPPSMETVLVELDLVCDATVDGSMPVEVETVASEALDGRWLFAARAADTAAEPSVSPLDGRAAEDPDVGSPRSPAGSSEN